MKIVKQVASSKRRANNEQNVYLPAMKEIIIIIVVVIVIVLECGCWLLELFFGSSFMFMWRICGWLLDERKIDNVEEEDDDSCALTKMI